MPHFGPICTTDWGSAKNGDADRSWSSESNTYNTCDVETYFERNKVLFWDHLDGGLGTTIKNRMTGNYAWRFSLRITPNHEMHIFLLWPTLAKNYHLIAYFEPICAIDGRSAKNGRADRSESSES